jgi:hypothetical protein
VLQFQAQEALFNFTYLFQICLHVLVLWFVFLVGEVDEKLGVTLDGETLDPQGGRGPEADNQALVFCDVVGDLPAMLEAKLHGGVELVLDR